MQYSTAIHESFSLGFYGSEKGNVRWGLFNFYYFDH